MVSSGLNIRKWFMYIVAVRLLSMLLFYPCIFDYDSALGLRTFLSPPEVSATCNHHVVFVQAIHASFYSFGKMLGSESAGMALLTVFHILLSSMVLVYGLRIIAQAGVSQKWQKITACLYAFFPIFVYLSILPTKDGFFNYSFLLYAFTIYQLYQTKGRALFSGKFMVLHGLATLMSCLTRNQGFYIVAIESLLLLFFYREYLRRVIAVAVLPLVVFLVYDKVLLPSLNVEPGGKQEIYHVFFQQTANYLRQYPEEVSAEELAAINEVFDADSAVALYSTKITDPVKNLYRYRTFAKTEEPRMTIFVHVDKTGEKEKLGNYMKAWFEMGKRHPLCYIEATMGVVSGYLWNFYEPLVGTCYSWEKLSSADVTGYSFFHFTYFDSFFFKIQDKAFYHEHSKISFLKYILGIPLYMWMMLLLIAFFLICRRPGFREIVTFMPMFLSVVICAATAYAYGRYAYPAFVIVPILLAHIQIKR